MLTRPQLAAALTGIGRILRFDPKAFPCFDRSRSGFWASFWAAALALPVWALAVAQHLSQTELEAPLRYVALQAIAYVIGWLLYPFVMVRISIFLGRWPAYFTYMVPYNWFQLAQSLFWLPVLLLSQSGAVPANAIAVLWLSTHAVLFTYAWFLARRGLGVDNGTALALVLIDFLLGLLLDGITDALV